MIRLKNILTEQRSDLRRKSTIQKYVEAMIYVLDFAIDIFKTEGLTNDEGEDPAKNVKYFEQVKTKLSAAAEKVSADMNYDNFGQLEDASGDYIYVLSDLYDVNSYAARAVEKITAKMGIPRYDLETYYRKALYSGTLNQKVMAPKEATLLRQINNAIPMIYSELPKLRNAFLNQKGYDPSRSGDPGPDTPDDQELKSAGYKLIWPGKIDLPNGKYAAVILGRIATIYKDSMSSDPDVYKPKVQGNKLKNTGYAYTIEGGFRCPGRCAFYIDIVNGQVNSNEVTPIKIYFNSTMASKPEFTPSGKWWSNME